MNKPTMFNVLNTRIEAIVEYGKTLFEKVTRRDNMTCVMCTTKCNDDTIRIHTLGDENTTPSLYDSVTVCQTCLVRVINKGGSPTRFNKMFTPYFKRVDIVKFNNDEKM